MAKIPYETAEAFMRRKAGSNGAFCSVGDALYTYAERIAHWEGDAIVWDIDPENPPKWSATSARHIRAALFVIPLGFVDTDGKRRVWA